MVSRLANVWMIASVLVAGALFVPGSDACAAQASASVGVTVRAAGGFGSATTPATSPSVTGTNIPTIPVSTTSNVGYGDVAPVTQTASTDATPAARRALPGATRGVGRGASTSVAVAGAPNQAFSVMLPSPTAYVAGDQVVVLSRFAHNAGATPTVGSAGMGIFNIGALVDQSVVGDIQTAAVDTGAVLDRAFTQRSPIVNIVVSYN